MSPEISLKRPSESEFAPYYNRYVSLVPEGEIVSILENQIVETLELFRGLSEEKQNFAYAEGKWTVKEMLGHIVDSERVFAYRAMAIARGEQQSLPGYEQDEYVTGANFGAMNFNDLTEEFEFLRKSNVRFFRNLSAEAWQKIGTASDAEISVRAIGYILAGHEIYHVKILKERYLI